jgi:uncharacterized protein YecT (DUF1311 family)
MKFVIPAVLLLLMPGFTHPQKPGDPCAGETTVEMKQCAAKHFREADDELNRVYRQLTAKLDDEGHKAALKTAQQAWLNTAIPPAISRVT